MDKVTLKEILSPIDVNTFFKEYWGKKHLVIRRNKFNNLYTFKDLNNYLNRLPDVKSLQILNYDNKDTRWCLDKVKKGQLRLPMLTKDEIYKLWKDGKTFVLALMEYEKPELVDICFELEKYFGNGCCNVYASPQAKSKSFPVHADSTENFLFHTEGRTKWTMYKEFKPMKPKTILDEFVLDEGDLLYIPTYQYHKVETIGPRMLISAHFYNKKNQTLDNFKITSNKENKRRKNYNWVPDALPEPKIRPHRKMQKKTWSKPYFKESK